MYDVAIINYEMGNLRSVQSACNYVGLKTIITNDPKIIENSKSMLLPGVGAFNQAMKNINKFKLKKIIINFKNTGKPIIGVCLGMQLLFEESEEIKKTKGLGIIKGKVTNLVKNNIKKNSGINIGWSKVKLQKLINSNMYSNLNDKSFYFIHKFCCNPKSKKIILGKSRFNNIEFCSIIKFENIEGYQFHPEKSGKDGLMVYNNLKKKIMNENSI
jgi:imidazole glycerol-phosphate synthase subunit HisH